MWSAFLELCYQLPLADDNKMAILKWKSALPRNISLEYQRRQKTALSVARMLPAGLGFALPGLAAGEAHPMDLAVPETSLKSLIRHCVEIEQDNQLLNASAPKQDSSSSDKSQSKLASGSDPAKKAKSDVAAPAVVRSSGQGASTMRYCKYHKKDTRHSEAECYLNPANRTGIADAASGQNKSGVSPTGIKKEHSSKSGSSGECFTCGSKDHWAKNCPKKSASVAVKAVAVQRDADSDLVSLPNGRCFPASSILLRAGQLDVYLPASGTLHTRNLPDTGADESFIDQSVVDALELPTFKPTGVINQALSGSSVPRLAKLAQPLEITLLFPGDSSNRKPVTVSHRFEVANINGKLKSGPMFIIGRDLLGTVFPDGIPACYFKPRGGGPDSPALAGQPLGSPPEGKATAGDGRNDISLSLVNVATSERSDVESSLNELKLAMDAESDAQGKHSRVDDLAPIKPSVYTAADLEAEFERQRQHIYNDPRFKAAVAANEALRPDQTCNLPGSVFTIEIEDALKGTLFRKQYPIAQKLMELVDQVIKRWLSNIKLERTAPGCDVNNPLTIVPKKDADGNLTGIRVCLDVRFVNAALKRSSVDHFPIPYIRRVLEHFADCTIFGELDLEEAYLQMPLHPDSRKYTAFTWRGVQYQFTCVPFGLEAVPSWFQRLMSVHVGSVVPCTAPYFDNFPFGSKSWEEHLEHAVQLLTCLTARQLRVKPSSIKLGQSHMKSLGHIVSGGGVGIAPDKVQAIDEWPLPDTGAALQSFLGLAIFVRDHVRHFADLTGLTGRGETEEEFGVWADALRW